MKHFKIQLIGLFDTVVFRWEGPAQDKYHAMRIASATYNDCYKRAEETH